MSEEQSNAYQGWAVVEVMGHRSHVGEVSGVVQFGEAMLRIDALEPDGVKTHFYPGRAIFGITPCSEEWARDLAERRARPVSMYGQLSPAAGELDEDLEDEEGEEVVF